MFKQFDQKHFCFVHVKGSARFKAVFSLTFCTDNKKENHFGSACGPISHITVTLFLPVVHIKNVFKTTINMQIRKLL
jgi:hypothetical protein